MSTERITSHNKLGFIGVGYLGSRVARRLMAAGFPITVYDSDAAKTSAFGRDGAAVARSLQELAGAVDVAMSCVPDSAAVQEVYYGTGKILQSARRGLRVIELSTIDPETASALHQAGRQRGISVLDVAISGSTPAAEAGNLTLFGGGERADFEAAEPVFSAIAKQWFYMGPGGSGVAMKLVVNTLLGLEMQAIAEAIALGSGLGLSRGLLLDVLAKTAVVAPAHMGKLATAKENDYKPQFPIRLMHKDFGLILAEAARLGLAMPATEAAARTTSAEAERGVEEDFSAVIRRMEEQVEKEQVSPPAR